MLTGPVLTGPVLLFDGGCGFCRTWVARLARWDRNNRIRMVAAQERAAVEGLPHIQDEDLDRAMHLVTPDGRVFRGARALEPMLRYLPGGGFLRPLLFIPGVQSLADLVYARIAANRHRLGCGGAACRWPGST